jgi:hypothetical protein
MGNGNAERGTHAIDSHPRKSLQVCALKKTTGHSCFGCIRGGLLRGCDPVADDVVGGGWSHKDEAGHNFVRSAGAIQQKVIWSRGIDVYRRASWRF